jgi:hypothetical protein
LCTESAGRGRLSLAASARFQATAHIQPKLSGFSLMSAFRWHHTVRLKMRRWAKPGKQQSITDEDATVMKPFLVEVRRLADGTTTGRVTDPASGRTEVFHGWAALLSVLADEQSPTAALAESPAVRGATRRRFLRPS